MNPRILNSFDNVRITNRMGRLLASTASAGLMMAAGTGVAHAQEATAQSGVQEIIVTAQKREQSIQDVPIAVSAVGQASLQANRVVSVADLTGLAPGLVTKQTAGSLRALSFSMRGINANPSAPLQDKEVSVYIDGVYVGGSRGTMGDLQEVQRIEVLRGPQGTLFGRNSTAGAVNIVTRDPTGEMAFSQDVTVGNQSQFHTRTTIDTPQIGPFSAILSYTHDHKNGDVKNLGAGTVWDRTNPFTGVGRQTSPNYLGGRNFNDVFAAVKFDDGGNFTATYKFDYSRGSFVGSARVTPVINTQGERIGGVTYGFYPNAIGTLLTQIIAAQPPGGGIYGPITLNPGDRRPDAINGAWDTPGYQRVQGHSLVLNWNASDHITVKNTTGYRQNVVFSGGSSVAGLSGLQFTPGAVAPYAQFVAIQTPGFATMTPAQQQAIVTGYINYFTPLGNYGLYFAPYEGQSYGKHWQFSDELQVNYTSDKANVTAGLLYYQEHTTDSALPGFAPNVAFAPVPTTIPLGNGTASGGAQESIGYTKSYAAYAQLEYNFTNQLGVVLGGRWTHDDKTAIYHSQGLVTGDTITWNNIITPSPFKKSKFTYSLDVNYKPREGMLFYAKYATGFVSGGQYADIPFAPETAKSWEGGAKLDLLDRRVRLNVAAYSVKYSNQQSTTSGRAINRPDLPIAVVTNGAVKVKGVETELTIAPAEGLVMGVSAGYTDSKYENPDPKLADGYTDLAVSGSPKWVGNVYGQYVTPPLFGDATLLLRADMNFQSRAKVIQSHQAVVDFPAFAPYEWQPRKQIVNVRAALQDIDVGGAKLELAVWSKNLFQNRKPIYPFQYPYFLMTTTYEQARTFGVDLKVKFKP